MMLALPVMMISRTPELYGAGDLESYYKLKFKLQEAQKSAQKLEEEIKDGLSVLAIATEKLLKAGTGG